MTATRERELKLDVEPEFALPPLGDQLAERVFVSTYYDTTDRRLARAGATLRRRIENGRSLWQLKLPHGVARLELEVPPRRRARSRPQAVVRRGRARSRLRARRAARGRDVRRGRGRVDRRDGGSPATAREGARAGDGRPKVLRVLDWEQPAQAPLADPTLERLRAGLRGHADALLAHDPGVRLARDPEELHQQRVATRRLRALLRAARDFVDPAWAVPLRAELGWLGSALGRVRDLDVLVEHLQAAAAKLDEPDRQAFVPVLARLRRSRT